MKSKRIIALVLALVLTLGSVFSLSSCLSTLLYVLESSSPNGSGDSEQGQDSSNGGQGSGTGSSSSSDDEGEREAEFLPGSENNGELIESVGASYKTLLSTVVITSSFEVYSGSFNGYDYGDSTSVESSAGSGVIYSLDREAGDAYIITNYHVVYNSDAITQNRISSDISVYLYGQEYSTYAIPATYVGGSLTYDIAVLKIEDSEVIKNSLAVAATVADSDKVAVMDECFVVGNPEGDGMAVTTGTVSVDSETLDMVGADGRTSISLRVMRVCAAVNHGNSGGGLYDSEGRLIGIVTAKKTGSDVDNIGYAIPINLAKNLVLNILSNCDGEDNTSIQRALLGITLTAYTTGLTVDAESGKIIKSELVEIVELSDSCLMSDTLAVGDIITSITLDGVTKEVTRTHHVIDVMLAAGVGSVVTITANRAGETVTATVTIPESSITTVK